MAGIDEPESVAEHCFRCALIGYYLAHLEGVDPYPVLVMTLFNDIHEARINDLHKMGHHYIDFKAAEQAAFKDQIGPLPQAIKEELGRLRGYYDRQDSRESLVARDADILECLLQAREYEDHGHKVARKFFRVAPGFLKTGSAKRLWRAMLRWDSSEWWEHVVKFER